MELRVTAPGHCSGQADRRRWLAVAPRKKKLGEIDTLVLFADRAIVAQAKSKKLTLLARKGNDLQLQTDFRGAVQDSCDQALSCSSLLLDGKAFFTDSVGNELPIPTIKHIHPLCVVSDHYPALSFQSTTLS